MKFLALVFAIVLVVLLVDIRADNLSFNDLVEEYEEQPNIDYNDIIMPTGDMSSLARRCNFSLCNTLCRRQGWRRGVCITATLCRCSR